MFKIDSDVPAPSSLPGRRRYPFGEMKVGDSFLIADGLDYNRIANSAHSFARANSRGWKFSIRKTPEGHRCWRIK